MRVPYYGFVQVEDFRPAVGAAQVLRREIPQGIAGHDPMLPGRWRCGLAYRGGLRDDAHQVRRLPVVEGDRLIGIVAQADIALVGRDKKTGQVVEEISR